MVVRTWIAALACLFVASMVVAAPEGEKKPAAGKGVPEEAVGFVGTLEGSVLSKKGNGNTVTINVASATPAADSKVKDGAGLVGKEIRVKVRFVKSDGSWKGTDEDTTFVKGLKKGDAIRAEVMYIESQKAIAMTAAPSKVEEKKE